MKKEEIQNPNPFGTPELPPRFFHGVRRPPSGSGSRKAVYGPLSERGFPRHNARKKHHCALIAIMFFLRETPGCQKRGNFGISRFPAVRRKNSGLKSRRADDLGAVHILASGKIRT
jgi:hypothetical protein